MRHFFRYAGKDSSDFGAFIASAPFLSAPARVVDTVGIPGRNGTLSIDQGRYENAELEYAMYVPEGVQPNLDGLRAFLLSSSAYRRLEDTLRPDEYRMARFTGGIGDVSSDRLGGSFALIFDAMPQRFLLSGEMALSLNAASSVFNPTPYDALPLIRAYGASGTVTVNGSSLAFRSGYISTYVDIDCETQDCYEGRLNRNPAISSGTFPRLTPGENAISFSGFSRLEITPRFWTL